MKNIKIIVFVGLILLTLSSCQGPYRISGKGLNFVKIGGDMPKVENGMVKKYYADESRMIENGFSWDVIELETDSGKIFIESDFDDENRVGRIRVESPEFKSKKGLRVGMTMNDLLKANDSWTVKPFPEYKLMEVYTDKLPHVVFLVDEVGFNYENANESVTMNELAPDSKITAIVVF